VLLTLSSIFLCGIVVTYVANADNYRGKYTDIKTERDGLDRKLKAETDEANKYISEKQHLEDKLRGEITSLKTKVDKLDGDLDNAEREKAALLAQVESWTSITKDFYTTNDKQGALLANTLNELKRVQAEEIKQRKDLSETTAQLIEKMAIVEQLQTDNKRLLEEKAELQAKLDNLLRPAGKAAAQPVPVTPEETNVSPAGPATVPINLKGLVTNVDLENSMVEISIGKVDGVKEGMKFYVTRGDEFICDILIYDVETDRAVGLLDLMSKQPKAGDSVSTNL
jgi:flagellar biosynthesis/type III secretory pathway chaperone